MKRHTGACTKNVFSSLKCGDINVHRLDSLATKHGPNK